MEYVAIAAGAFVGSILRYLSGEWVWAWFPAGDGFPIGTLTVNLIGCLVLGWFYTITTMRWKASDPVRIGVGTGLLGSFTTFSTFSVETVQLIDNGHTGPAVIYVSASVFGGLLLAAVGRYAAKAQAKPGSGKGES